MKKLLDESTDELTRSLLQAGRSQRPPAASRARLLVALGAAGGVGLFSSKAFAWLGTSAGKLTLLGVGVAVAGGAYTLAASPSTEVTRVSALSSPALSSAAQSSPALAAPTALGATELASSSAAAAAPLAAAPVAATAPSSVPASAAGAPVNPRVASPGLSGAAARRRVAPTSSEAHRSSRTSSGSAARRDDALERMEPQRDGSLSAELEPPAGRTVAQTGDQALVASNLQSEIQLVDAMRGAAQRRDAEALRRLMDDYRGAFPEGQLKREVSELALRTLPPAGR